MKTHALLRGIAGSVLIALLAAVALMAQNAPEPTDPPPEASWQKVNEARDKGLPQTAISHLEPIIAEAMAAGRHAEAIKAICTKIAFEGQIEGNKTEENVVRLEAALAEAPDEMRPLMQAILANWYWTYFQQNRWRFQQRTQTAEAPGDDFTTWDLARIIAEIDKHFTLALANEEILKATPIAEFDDLLLKGNMPDDYRPTLFDFIAHDALRFYQAGEQGIAMAEDTFAIADVSPVFAPVDEFLAWDPETTDTNSPRLKAVRLFQNLLAFHRAAENTNAFIDADLHRLNFGKNQAFGPEVNSNYSAALERFIEEWAENEISARAMAHQAIVLNQEGEHLQAHALASHAIETFPGSIGAEMCYNLIQSIEARHLNISTERVWNEPWPVITVEYKNLTNVYLRAVAYDFNKYAGKMRWGYSDNLQGLDWKVRDALIEELLKKRPATVWQAELPPTADYRQRSEEVAVPEDLPKGFYFILSSANPEFSENDNVISLAAVWVSDLSLVVRNIAREELLDGFVLNARTGEPVEGARIHTMTRQREGGLTSGPRTTTDTNGMFRLANRSSQLIIIAEKNDDTISGSQMFSTGNRSRTPSRDFTTLFTDRALYRPGQAIHYNGIHHHVDVENNRYHLITGRRLTVVLLDPNNREVTRQQHVSNDFGTFSGSFTAPAGTVTGTMTIRMEGCRHGSMTRINVEEYKRPRFRVEINRPVEAARLDAETTVTGKATAYTGAAVGGAQVRWRVVREVRFPPWCWWGVYSLRPGREGAQNIAHGTATTANDGSFEITFTARPDLSVPEATEPTFSFRIYADVTDTTGETRSAQQTVRAGYTALNTSLHAADWQTADQPVKWRISTTSLDGEPQFATGTLQLHSLVQPEAVIRAQISGRPRYDYWWFRRNVGRSAQPAPDPANPETWQVGELVGEQSFQTGDDGNAEVQTALPAGIYRATLKTIDRFGKPVSALRTFQVIDPAATHYQVKVPHHFAAPQWALEPGSSFKALWGTGYDNGRAFVEIRHRENILHSFWTDAERTQQMIEYPVTEELRGGFSVIVTYVRENRAYFENHIVDIPWSNKQLDLRWETFRSKLTPGEKEIWTAVIGRKNTDGNDNDLLPAVAEMVATLYDASLDQYLPHNWLSGFGFFRREHMRVYPNFQNQLVNLQRIKGQWQRSSRSAHMLYRRYPSEISNIWGRIGARGTALGRFGGGVRGEPVRAMRAGVELQADGMLAMEAAAPAADMAVGFAAMDARKAVAEPEAPLPDLDEVAARQNLDETAFFMPHLISAEDGNVRMEFSMPEALTEWKFMGFAHDKEMRSGLLSGTTVTAKDLMVQPNPPRFLREGDILEFTVKVSNQSPEQQQGRVRLTLADARTLDDMTAALGISQPEQAFDVPSMEARTYSWRITVPDDCGFLIYKAVGASATLSDGEEGYLPVLSRRIMVTESLPLPIRGAQTKDFTFKKLLESGASDTLQSQNLTVQMVSQPAWYAVMALPYLIEYPFECSEQVFNRLYANNLARYIANSDPKIRRVFDQWKNTPALDSPLEKNQDLKEVMLEETPWLRQAKSESQARRNVGILFDANRLDSETARAFDKLAQMQFSNGMWPWFPGFREDPYITLYITTGFGRLRHLGADNVDMSLALKALNALDNWMEDRYRYILRHGSKDGNNLTPIMAFYLYGRSFFLADRPVAENHQEALQFWLEQGRENWLSLRWRQPQGHLAIGLQRFGDKETAQAIMRSIKEHSVTDEEMGMFWRDTELSWWWYRAPIETQALMIEAFDEVMGDAESVENCKVWLLKQKQTRDWKTTKATADAVYGLLLRGTGMLASDALVEVRLGGELIEPKDVEAGTGFYEQRFVRGEIKPAMGNISVTKTDDGVSWGSVHWQYLEDISKVTPHEETPLKLTKRLYRKVFTDRGPLLEAVRGPVSVGDELVCRIEVRVDRDMEYVHLKDQRGSGTEPVNVLSRTKYQDGLAYYESTRDTASHFFIHYLPKGVYVFEYSVFVQHRGVYQSGIANIQCMYAPEFNSHSESFEIVVE